MAVALTNRFCSSVHGLFLGDCLAGGGGAFAPSFSVAFLAFLFISAWSGDWPEIITISASTLRLGTVHASSKWITQQSTHKPQAFPFTSRAAHTSMTNEGWRRNGATTPLLTADCGLGFFEYCEQGLQTGWGPAAPRSCGSLSTSSSSEGNGRPNGLLSSWLVSLLISHDIQ
jgi:hypothetical protein